MGLRPSGSRHDALQSQVTGDGGGDPASGAPEEEPADSQDASQHCLWVDEFAPQRYTELLSDDVRPCSCSDVTGFFVAEREEL